MDLYLEALGRFHDLLQQARGCGLNEPMAMTVATADVQGRPSARTVLLKVADERGFVFYTNTESRKGLELAANPRAALCFHWDPLRQQVLVEGGVRPVDDDEADAYWATRARDSQLGAWASRQSRPLDSRRTLEAAVLKAAARWLVSSVPRPPHWSGYRLVPDRMEFWKAQPHRLNDRVLYRKQDEVWVRELLYP